MGIFDALKGRKGPNLSVSSVNIKWKGRMHTRDGFQITENPFTVEIPFQNVDGGTLFQFKSQAPEPLNVSKIEIAQPFVLESVSPGLPFQIKSGEKQVFSIKVRAPDYSYSGPLSITFTTQDQQLVHVEINKVVLHTPDKTVEIEKSAVMFNIPKGQIFKNDVQMYKAFSFGAQIKEARMSDPFKLVSSDPKMPFTVNVENSYIVSFYIQAPDSDYAGSLDVFLK
ncbi:MAG: hypothetical protein KGH98_03740 [Candidatus Micrarchaeota archaeon]|nr:hypothetical protein [Candidatus Micrarchaeota archaeon]